MNKHQRTLFSRKAHFDKAKAIYRYTLHLVFWLLFWGAQVYFGIVSFNDLNHTPAVYLSPLHTTICLIIIYYPLVYYIIPKLFLKKKYFRALLAALLLFIAYSMLNTKLELSMYKNCHSCMITLKNQHPDYYRYLSRAFIDIVLTRLLSLGALYQLIILIAVPAGIKLGRAYYQQRIKSLQLEKENTSLELNFLKAQVNPHFLFNSLNNIYALINANQKEESAAMVTRLADFLRYSLYQDDKDNTIGKEMQLLKDYIDLERIRFNHTVVNCNFDIDNTAAPFPPMLLLPLVENAFKFCIEDEKADSWIMIHLKMKDKLLGCKIANTYRATADDETNGIGIHNVRKRLERYYKGNYKFEIIKEKDVFNLMLQIKLS